MRRFKELLDDLYALGYQVWAIMHFPLRMEVAGVKVGDVPIWAGLYLKFEFWFGARLLQFWSKGWIFTVL